MQIYGETGQHIRSFIDTICVASRNFNHCDSQHSLFFPNATLNQQTNLDNSGTMRLRGQDSPLTFTLKPHNGNIRLSATHITSNPEETQHDLAKRIAAIANLSLHRLRVTFETSNRVLDKRIHQDSPPKVGDIPDEETVLIIKDLGRTRRKCADFVGPQVSWRLVFVIEYIGPILLHPMFYYCQKLFYGRSFDHSLIQTFIPKKVKGKRANCVELHWQWSYYTS